MTISEETRNKDAISEETRNNANRRGLANSTLWNNCDFGKFLIWNEISDVDKLDRFDNSRTTSDLGNC